VTRIVPLIVLIVITQAVLSGGGGYPGQGGEALLLGFLLLAAHLAGEIGGLVQLPHITGFILLGVLVGPSLLGILPRQAVDDFHLINGGALSLIALTAGGELRLDSVRRKLATILSVLSSQIVILFTAVAAAVFLGRSLVPFLADAPPRAALAVGLIFGLGAVATSPAATVAIITEERARGAVTETVLGVTVLKDVVVLVLIALVLPLAAQIADPGVGFSFGTLGEVLIAVLVSVAVGLGVGWLLVQYLRKTSEYRVLVLLMTAFFLVSLGEQFHLEYILIAMAAGFYVQNFSRQGPAFLRGLEANSLPVYALFFAVAGAELRLDVLQGVWAFALLVIFVRILGYAASTRIGAKAAGDSGPVASLAWMGFLSQAGVTLGIANMVRDRFDVWGADVATVIIAMIAVHELIGPPIFRYALIRAGETRATRRRAAAHAQPGGTAA
jgi:Kef-type K+ transport system membrane component KefB